MTSAETDQAPPILFRDERLLVVHKPSGLLVHRSRLDAGERRSALQALRRALRRRVHPVHRLDKAASGALLVALDPESARACGALVRSHGLERTYLAVVRGTPPASGTIDHPLAPVRDGGGPRTTTARAARTRFVRLATVELPHRVDRYPTSRYSLLRLDPLTGRRHQLRRHLHHVSHPILGDTTWGKARHDRLFAELFGTRRLLLACVELRFVHPFSGAAIRVCAPLAPDFARVLDGLGWAAVLPSEWRSGGQPPEDRAEGA